MHKSRSYNWILKVVFVGLMLSELFNSTLLGYLLGYFDEVVGVAFTLTSAVFMVTRKGRTEKTVAHLFFCMFGIVVIGLMGNLVYQIQGNIGVVLTGAYISMKSYLYGLFMLLTLPKYDAKEFYSFLVKLSKAMLCLMTVCALVYRFVNIGMAGTNGEFIFLGSFGGTASLWSMLFLAVCYSQKQSNRVLWYIMAAVIIISSNSGLGKLGLVLLIMVYFFFEKNKRFHWYYLIPIACIGIWVSWGEIQGYLLDEEAPRARLWRYAFVTANHYFPLGSGFSTYGSPMAMRYYSNLYYDYGFNNQWGMTAGNTSFIMDSYYPMLIGEIGYFGIVIFAILICLYIGNVIMKTDDKYLRNSALYIYGILLIAGLGFGTGSSWGCAVYTLVPLLAKLGQKEPQVQAARLRGGLHARRQKIWRYGYKEQEHINQDTVQQNQ